MTDETPSRTTCANCGATVSDAYCGVCGQSRDALDRSFFALVGEQLGDIVSWDGRLLSTVRELFMRPGRVAREFVEGKRVSHTPPMRMLLLASLALFAVMSVFELRIVAVAIDAGIAPTGEDTPLVPRSGATITLWDDAETDEGTAWALLTVTAFGGDRSSRLTPAPPEVLDALANDGDDDQFAFLYDAFRAPAELERAVNAAATQALFSMVALFAILNLLLHPRRPFLLHATHALYFHAAIALALAVLIVPARLLSIPGDWVVPPVLLALMAAAIVYERGCYGTTVLGLLWRIPLLLMGYAYSLALVLFAFTALLIPH